LHISFLYLYLLYQMTQTNMKNKTYSRKQLNALDLKTLQTLKSYYLDSMLSSMMCSMRERARGIRTYISYIDESIEKLNNIQA
jgi:hypothetical protein